MCDKLYLVDQKVKEIIFKVDIFSLRKEFSVCVIGCKVYIIGGWGFENGVLKDVWVYDILYEEWFKVVFMLVVRFGYGFVELKYCLYVVGGYMVVIGCFLVFFLVFLKQVEYYDFIINKWIMVVLF